MDAFAVGIGIVVYSGDDYSIYMGLIVLAKVCVVGTFVAQRAQYTFIMFPIRILIGADV